MNHEHISLILYHGAGQPQTLDRLLDCHQGRYQFIPGYSGDWQPPQAEYQTSGQWEAFWRGSLLVQAYRHGCCKPLARRKKFKPLRDALKAMPIAECLKSFSSDLGLISMVSDALAYLTPSEAGKDIICPLYDGLEGFDQLALTGLCQLVQFCQARSFDHLQAKILVHKDLWQPLFFCNKSHFRDMTILMGDR